VPWDGIASVSAGEFHHNPAVFISLRDLGVVIAQLPQSGQQVMRHLRANLQWIGVPIMLMTSQYGMDLPVLMAALERYIADPSARTELSRKQLAQALG